MHPKKAHLIVSAEPGDYFFVASSDANTFSVSLVDGSRFPVRFEGLTRRQVLNLATQVHKVIMAACSSQVVRPASPDELPQVPSVIPCPQVPSVILSAFGDPKRSQVIPEKSPTATSRQPLPPASDRGTADLPDISATVH